MDKHCPLFAKHLGKFEECTPRCAWYVKDGNCCAIVKIAENLKK
jgi:hypothetical protein